MNQCDDASIQKYRDLLVKVQETDKDNTMFIKLLKSTVGELEVKQRGVAASQAYLSQKQNQ